MQYHFQYFSEEFDNELECELEYTEEELNYPHEPDIDASMMLERVFYKGIDIFNQLPEETILKIEAAALEDFHQWYEQEALGAALDRYEDEQFNRWMDEQEASYLTRHEELYS